MSGFITERDLEQADEAFPGILRFYEALAAKPPTFLSLLALFEKVQSTRAQAPAA